MMVTSVPGEVHRCRYCGADSMSVWCRATDRNRRAGNQLFTVARCGNCGILQTQPWLAGEALSAYYPEEYFPDPDRSPELRSAERKKVAFVQRYCGRGSLLDIGAGTGLFVREAADAGFAAEGIEISREAAELGRRSLGVSLTAGDLLDLHLPGAAYDVVTLWHVLEHLPFPHAALQKISLILRDAGTLIVAVPNAGSVQARLFRSRWFHLDVPRHLFHYTPATLARVFRDAGFEVRETVFRHREHDSAGILGSIIRLSPPGESFLHKVVRKTVGVPAANLLAAGEVLATGESGTFIMVGQKGRSGRLR